MKQLVKKGVLYSVTEDEALDHISELYPEAKSVTFSWKSDNKLTYAVVLWDSVPEIEPQN